MLLGTALETLASLGAKLDIGWSPAPAAARLGTQGANEVPPQPRRSLRRSARKFWGTSAWLIEAIVVRSFVLHKFADASIALALLVVNAVIGFAQEQRGLAAVTALEDVIARVVAWLLGIVGVLVAVTLVVAAVRGIRFVEGLPVALVLRMNAVPVAPPVMFTVRRAVGSMARPA